MAKALRRYAYLIGEFYMTSFGMIHMACYCGADLYYIGNSHSGRSPEAIIKLLKKQVGPGDSGFFTIADGEYGECPFCGLGYELPGPDILDWLPFMDVERFSSTVAELQRTGVSHANQLPGHPMPGRYLS